MGIHIGCFKSDGTEHPEWNWLRESHDRDFVYLIDDKIWFQSEEKWPPLDDDFFVPADIPALLTKLEKTDWKNKSRYVHLLELVKQGCWIHVSW